MVKYAIAPLFKILREDEIKQHNRDIAIEDIIFESKVLAVIDFFKNSDF